MLEFDDSCEWVKRQVAAVTTAGMDLVHEYRSWVEPEVTNVEMVQSYIDALSRAVCSTTTHTMPHTSDPDFPEADPGQVFGPETSGTETTTTEASTTETGRATEKTDEDEDEEVEEGGTGRMSPSAVLVGMLAIVATVFP